MGNTAVAVLGRNAAACVLGEELGMPLGPFVQGTTGPDWSLTALKADNSALNLTGATYAAVLYSPETNNRKTAAGTLSTTTAASGIFAYVLNSADLDTPGYWIFEVKITISSKDHFLRYSYEVLPRLAS